MSNSLWRSQIDSNMGVVMCLFTQRFCEIVGQIYVRIGWVPSICNLEEVAAYYLQRQGPNLKLNCMIILSICSVHTLTKNVIRGEARHSRYKQAVCKCNMHERLLPARTTGITTVMLVVFGGEPYKNSDSGRSDFFRSLLLIVRSYEAFQRFL